MPIQVRLILLVLFRRLDLLLLLHHRAGFVCASHLIIADALHHGIEIDRRPACSIGGPPSRQDQRWCALRIRCRLRRRETFGCGPAQVIRTIRCHWYDAAIDWVTGLTSGRVDTRSRSGQRKVGGLRLRVAASPDTRNLTGQPPAPISAPASWHSLIWSASSTERAKRRTDHHYLSRT